MDWCSWVVERGGLILGSGRLPTQVEWECMFSEERLGWDDHGVRPVREEAVKSYVAELES